MPTSLNVKETLETTWGNLREFFGGVAAPLSLALTGIVFLLFVAVCWKHLRPRHRIGFAVVPDPEFDPSDEEILRWSLGLAEARAAVGFSSESHRMVRLSICSDSEGKLVSLVGLNPRARSVAERTGYTGCELFTPEEILGANAPAWLPAPPAVDPAESADAEPALEVGVVEADRVVDSIDVTDRQPDALDTGWSFLPDVDDQDAAVAAASWEPSPEDVAFVMSEVQDDVVVDLVESEPVPVGARWEGLL